MQPILPFSSDSITLQAASWFIWNRSPKPALADKRVEIIFAECLEVFDADKRLDFAGLTRLLTKLENLHCDLAGDLTGDLAGDLAGRKTFPFLSFFDEFRMEGQAH